MITRHEAAVAWEVEHFMKVTDSELCRGGCKAVTEVGGRAMGCGVGQVRDGVDGGPRGTADGVIDGVELWVGKEAY
jgi:hypothetical protein